MLSGSREPPGELLHTNTPSGKQTGGTGREVCAAAELCHHCDYRAVVGCLHGCRTQNSSLRAAIHPYALFRRCREDRKKAVLSAEGRYSMQDVGLGVSRRL